MLCIIFTGTKMVVGAQTNSIELLRFGGLDSVDCQNQYTNTIQTHIQSITDSYLLRMQQSGLKTLLPIPLNLIFPVNIQQEEKKNLIHWIQSKLFNFNLIYVDNIPFAYLHAVQKQEQIFEENHLILEALGDKLNVVFHFSKKEQKKSQYFCLNNLGWKYGAKKVLEKLIISLADEGFIIDQTLEKDLTKQIKNYRQIDSFNLIKEKKGLSITANINLPAVLIEDLLTENRSILNQFLSAENLQKFNICNIILIGDYFDNGIFLNYICVKSNLKKQIFNKDTSNNNLTFLKLVNGATSKAQSIVKHDKKDQLKALMRNEIKREKFLNEIKLKCTNFQKIEAYKAYFISEGQKLGIPKEVIVWNIKESLAKINRVHAMNDLLSKEQLQKL